MAEVVCVPIMPNGLVNPAWGRAERVAVATIEDGQVQNWREFEVRWDISRNEGAEGQHHARVAKFLMEQGVTMVVANHMGGGMSQMLDRMKIRVSLGAEGDAHAAVLAAR